MDHKDTSVEIRYTQYSMKREKNQGGCTKKRNYFRSAEGEVDLHKKERRDLVKGPNVMGKT
jgi:hypothetical protein